MYENEVNVQGVPLFLHLPKSVFYKAGTLVQGGVSVSKPPIVASLFYV